MGGLSRAQWGVSTAQIPFQQRMAESEQDLARQRLGQDWNQFVESLRYQEQEAARQRDFQQRMAQEQRAFQQQMAEEYDPGFFEKYFGPLLGGASTGLGYGVSKLLF